MADFKLEEILVATGGSLVTSGALDTLVTGICTDSRKLEPGQAFLALRGENFDGHDFIHDAIKFGAKAVIGEKSLHFTNDITYIRVKKSRKALAKSSAHRAEF